MSWPSWPPPEQQAYTLWLVPEGTLLDAPAAAEGVESYRHDPDAGAQTFFGPSGYQLMPPLWDIEWTEFPPDHALAYLSPPLAETRVLAGSGHIVLWVASEAEDVHLQVTLTEVRPDNTEYWVQSGWLRLAAHSSRTHRWSSS